MALDIRLYIYERKPTLAAQLKELAETICGQAESYAGAVMPGYTHLQRAQPITFGHHLMASCRDVLPRDLGRLQDAAEANERQPSGSGAYVHHLSHRPHGHHRLLGFSDTMQNSLDGVSDRTSVWSWRRLCPLSWSICPGSLRRSSSGAPGSLNLSSWTTLFPLVPALCPKKKNPDIPNWSGKIRRVFGSLMTLLTMMKGLPLAYNKDMQEDKEAIFDAVKR